MRISLGKLARSPATGPSELARGGGVEGADFVGMGRISDTSSDTALTRFVCHGFAVGIKCPYLRDEQQPQLRQEESHTIRHYPHRTYFPTGYRSTVCAQYVVSWPNSPIQTAPSLRNSNKAINAPSKPCLPRHRDQVYTKLYLLVRDHDVAADLFQDVFIKVVDVLRSGKYNEEGKFLPWVLRIAHNAGIDHFRRQKKMPLSRGTEEYDLLGSLQDGNPTREEELISGRIMDDVRSLVEQLPEEQREVVQMRMYPRNEL